MSVPRVSRQQAFACALLWMVAGGGPASAQDPLTVGAEAPALEVTEWLRGDPTAIAEGHVTVLEFWATWCPLCRKASPGLSRMQRRFDADGVRIIAIAGPERDELGNVRKHLVETGDEFAYAVAWDGDNQAEKAWMRASGRRVFPVAFVVDRQRRLSWIGSPLEGLREAIEFAIDPAYDVEVAKKVFHVQRTLEKATYRKDRKAVVAAAETWLEVQPQSATPWIVRLHALARDPALATAVVDVARDATAALAERPRELARFAIRGVLGEVELPRACVALVADKLAEVRKARTRSDAEAPKTTSDDELDLAWVLALARTAREAEVVTRAARETIARLDSAEHLADLATGLLRERERYAGVAIAAAARASELEPHNPAHDRIRFDALAVYLGRTDEALEVGETILLKARGNAPFLNDLAWELVSAPSYGDAFRPLALRLAEALRKLPEGGYWMYLDTIAKAWFVNGFVREAYDLQKRATKECDNIRYAGELRERLDTYRRALEKGKD